MTVPDSVAGAVVLSVVDFVLSFAFIAAIGVLLALLPRLNRCFKLNDEDLTRGH